MLLLEHHLAIELDNERRIRQPQAERTCLGQHPWQLHRPPRLGHALKCRAREGVEDGQIQGAEIRPTPELVIGPGEWKRRCHRRGSAAILERPRGLAALSGVCQSLRRPIRQERSKLGLPFRRRHPTEPSICSWIRRFISTAYSIGSSFTIGSMKPETIIAAASSLPMPRLIR